jgi:hypothetical protein
MSFLFASFRGTLAALASAAAIAAFVVPVSAQSPVPEDNGTIPAGGKYKECHGYIRHVSDLNIKVHCIDGNASDQSFLYWPKYASLHDGKSIQTKELHPETPVHILYTQSLGIKKAYKIFVADPNGHGLYGFRS